MRVEGWNVIYDSPRGPQIYLEKNTTKESAERHCENFRRLYVGKPYPNGKGWYPFTNPRIQWMHLE